MIRRLRCAVLVFCLALPFLLAPRCGPVLPEEDPLLMSDPAAVERLNRDHAEVLAVLRAEDHEPVRFASDAQVLVPFAGLQGIIPRVRGVDGLSYTMDLPKEQCPGEEECSRFSFSLQQRHLLLFKREVQASFLVSFDEPESEGESPRITKLLPEQDKPSFEAQPLAQAMVAFMDELVASYERYAKAFKLERSQVLARAVGCPQGSEPGEDRSTDRPDQYWCERDGLRQGPYFEGNLSEVLEGARLVEGSYQEGQKHGSWVHRDEQGTLMRSERWEAGVLLEPVQDPDD